MTYIIPPSFFYLASVFDTLKFAAFIAFIVSAIVGCFAYGFYASELKDLLKGYGFCEKDVKNEQRVFKVSVICAIISLILAVLIPSKNTMIEIMVAKIATYENVNMTIGTIKAIMDYIVETAKQIG